MEIAILGGTGDIGQGLAFRWAADTDYTINIGSRDVDRAEDAVAEYEDTLSEHDINANLQAGTNSNIVQSADIVVLAVPPYHVSDTVESVSGDLPDDAIIVSPAVGMKSNESGLHYHRPGAGSVTAVAAQAAPDEIPVIGAFHNLSAHALIDLDQSLSLDTLVVGENSQAKETVVELAESISGIRALDAGPIDNAAEVESMTPLLINLARYNDGLSDVGVKFT
ncbi:NADPH-dependent F420 reductase [Salinarchaeum sp. IM2453]|uniref:NADPH-dependent F420 reductase n=1 Tax=Salinarchaeum sp. IM2453 TaxID=2862870 RepID=UPI001C8350A9|nr:NADPH-dependent F420 reductase [Salinarchaeum sp. IM2453]QZA89343.1 NADPH-dependent F420 reductase [Salinarchaeum sp. IM2453]